MTRDEIITIAGLLAKDLDNADTLDVFMNEVFRDNARKFSPPMVEAKIKSLTSGIAEYAFESDMLRILYLIMEDSLNSPVDEPSLDAYSTTWNTDTGTPTMFTQDDVDARNYLLYPIPDTTSDPLIPIHGEPFGEDWPANSLLLIYADDRESGISSIYSLPFAFDSLSREFIYPSDHTNEDFSVLCGLISQILYKLTEPKDA